MFEMKKIFIYLCLLLLFSSNAFAKNNTTVNDYIKSGYKITKVETAGKFKYARFYTLKKGNSILLCMVWLNIEEGRTNCYAP